MITEEFKTYLLSQCDGEWEVALLCGGSEPTDPGYERCKVKFRDGANLDECKFGPYKGNFRSAITGYALYYEGMRVGDEKVTPQTPAESEISTFNVGSIRITS